MSVRICWDAQENVACLYDSVSGVAFGEVFDDGDTYENAERFLDWLARKGLDPRAVQPNTLRALRREWGNPVVDEVPIA